MKRILLIVLSGIACVLSANAQITFGNAVKINDGWKFRLDSVADYSGVRVKDSGWRVVDLPHDWSVESGMSEDLYSCTGYLPGGTGWYRKTLVIPDSGKEKKQFLYFGGVYCNSEVWVNGNKVGYRPNGYVSFIYDITPFVKFGEKNCIAVKVDHSKQADSRWYTGSGIYRDVYLVSSGYVHIGNWGIFVKTADVRDGSAFMDVSLKMVNETDSPEKVVAEHRLYRKDASDVVASVRSEFTVPANGVAEDLSALEVVSPALWSVDTPNLYRLETVVYGQDGEYLDGTTTITGIRTTSFDPDKGFFLNGKNMKLKGVCLHHDAGVLGSVVPESVWRRRLLTLKSLGVNAIRTSHNLHDEMLYDLCDELGFVVKDEAFDEWEFPKRKWLEGWNVGKNPGLQGYAEYFNEWAETDLKTMVERDKNHPSIILWSIGNEVDYPNDPYSHPILDHEGINQKTIPGYKPERPNAERIGIIAEKFVRIVKDIDTSRAVTGAMAGVVMSNQTKYPFVLDVTGYNYTENRYVSDHQTYPDRIIYGSENRHEYPHWTAVRDNDFIFGQFLWTGIDYLGEAGRFPSRGMFSGILDIAGFVKPRGMYRKTLWSDEPSAYIGTGLKGSSKKNRLLFDLEPVWNYKAGDTVRVASFTNCDYVKLFVNGKEIKAAPSYDERSNARYWDIAYEPGTLSLEAWSGDGSRTGYEIRTYGVPERLEAVVDRQRIHTGDVVHVEVCYVDENGTRVRDADREIRCTVEGSGRLLGLENASPKYTGPYVTDTVPLYKGRMLAYIESSDEPGEISVKFTDVSTGKDTVVRINVME